VKSNTENLYGYIDRSGRFVIPPRYFWADDFKNGKANVGYLIRDRLVCDKVYEDVINTQGNSAWDGKGMSETCYMGSYHFGEGAVYPTENIEEYPKLSLLENDSSGEIKYGYKNKKNEWIISPQFSQAVAFSHGVAWVTNVRDGHYISGLINKKGDYVLPPKCLSAGNFHDGLAKCRVPVLFGRFY